MANINDVIKYAVRSEAGRIQRIKAAALKMQTMETYVCTSPDEKTARPGRPTKAEYEAGWRLRKVPYEKVIQHISPRHPDWQRYQAARRQASLLLTARLLLKLGGESVPDLVVVRRALKEGGLASHARNVRARTLSYAAWRYLRKLDNRLQRCPEKFRTVEEWLLGQQHTGREPGKEQVNV